ncbi:MAG: hypothetical protein FD164_650 [Nitrospirae bacterium]|nr:MAG: hypothetical protein FD164_650 [Nitrospirota bacterium]
MKRSIHRFYNIKENLPVAYSEFIDELLRTDCRQDVTRIKGVL